ncbi:replication initiation protein [Hymenobacter lapidarius]|uniref:replication initiation protein n=1 Tax=Hymenobacter lapidarius TaxID=1908237 RepID=UPI001EFAC020|nr:replication initiation protein [Hymenobacter lapidarius]
MKATISALEVRHHNALTNARYEYTELQLDIFYYLLSKLRKNQTDTVHEVHVQHMGELTGKQYNYKQLRLATQAMGNRAFEIETVDELGQQVFRQLWMFKRVDYVLGTGRIRIEFTEPAIPYLFELNNNFTSFELLAALSLTSKHAKRIYTICSRWQDKGETPSQTILSLKKTLGLVSDKGVEEYSSVAMFQRKVLDIAVRQVSESTNLAISYKLEKVGRSFTNIKFKIKTQAVAQSAPFTMAMDEIESSTQSTHQIDNVRRLLAQLNIVEDNLVKSILSNPAHVIACNKFAHELKKGGHADMLK